MHSHRWCGFSTRVPSIWVPHISRTPHHFPPELAHSASTILHNHAIPRLRPIHLSRSLPSPHLPPPPPHPNSLCFYITPKMCKGQIHFVRNSRKLTLWFFSQVDDRTPWLYWACQMHSIWLLISLIWNLDKKVTLDVRCKEFYYMAATLTSPSQYQTCYNALAPFQFQTLKLPVSNLGRHLPLSCTEGKRGGTREERSDGKLGCVMVCPHRSSGWASFSLLVFLQLRTFPLYDSSTTCDLYSCY